MIMIIYIHTYSLSSSYHYLVSCLSTSCFLCYSVILHTGYTIVILATIVTFHSSIKKKQKKHNMYCYVKICFTSAVLLADSSVVVIEDFKCNCTRTRYDYILSYITYSILYDMYYYDDGMTTMMVG